MEKIKVLMLSCMFPNQINPVLGIFVSELMPDLQKYCDIRVVSPVPWAPPFKWLPYYYQYKMISFQDTVAGVQVYRPRFFTFPRQYFHFVDGLSYYLSIKKLVAEIYHQWPFDLIHANRAYPDGFAGAKLKELYQKKMVVTIHGGNVYRTIHQLFCKRQVLKSLAASDVVICNSSKTARKVQDLIGDHKIKISHYGINPVVVEKNQIARELEPVIKGKTVILTVGYLIERKAHAYVLQALGELVQQYENLVYLIVGNGPQEKTLKALTRALGLENYVHFMGLRAYDEVWQFMDLCDIFVLPSWNEAFGVVYIEAMSQCKPVIGCRGEGIEDIITDGHEGLLVEAKNVGDLVEKLGILINDGRLRQAMGLAGRKRVNDRFTWQVKAQEIHQIYQEVLGRGTD